MRFLFAFTLFFSALARAQTAPKIAATPSPPLALTAAATIVLDLDSSRILQAKNPNARLFPASTTKIMTCLVALERGNLNQIIRAGKNAAATGESGIGLLAGENHTLRELIEAALVHSANDACVAIAEGVGANQAQFVAWMNQKARDLGCHDTHFVNPHGLHDPQHFTSAHDLALIGRAALKEPFLAFVVRQKSATIGGNWKIGPTRVMVNRNKLLFRWNQCDGLKTGYTRQAGNCLVASATQINRATGKPWHLLAVALKSAPGRSFGDCQMLLQKSFAQFAPRRVERGGEVVAQKPVRGGAFELQAVGKRDLWLPVNAFEGQTLQRRVQILPLAAPLRAGTVVGNVEYWAAPDVSSVQKPRRLARMTLFARGDVPQTLLARAIPPVGNRLGASSIALRTWMLALLCGGAASLLTFKRLSHARRRRPHATFQTTRLEPRSDASKRAPNSANPARRPRS